MKGDAPRNIATDIGLAVVHEANKHPEGEWNVYIINYRKTDLELVLIVSRGFGMKDGKNVKTTKLRHKIDLLPVNGFAKIEPIQPEIFGLTNEYWVSFFEDSKLFEKKYVFLPETIIKEHLIEIPMIKKNGVMLK